MWSVHFDQLADSLIFFSFALGVIGFWLWAAWPLPARKRSIADNFQKEHIGVLAAFILIFCSALKLISLGGWLGMAIFNILLLYQAVMMIASGCRDLNLKITTVGCVLFAGVTIARYTDLFVSLLARSLVFFITGAALFAVGMVYARSKKHSQREVL